MYLMIRHFFKACLAAQSAFVIFTLISLGYCTASAAQGLDIGNSNSDEFLKVEEAYQVMVELRDGKLEAVWSIAPGYYLYQHQFKVEANSTSEHQKLDLSFEPGHRKYDDYYQKELEVYYDNTYFSAPQPTLEAPYEIKVVSQGCADAGLCYPPRKQYFQVANDGSVFELENSMLAAAPSTTANDLTIGTPAQDQPAPFLPFILIGALLGGLVLNLMPCVFPVLSLKALSFASSGNSGHQHSHGWAYTAGVVLAFLVAAGVILVARQAGEMLGWGFQLQQPLFVAALVYLFLVMGLSLFGMFNFGTQFMGAGQELTTGSGVKASFFTGVLAAVVASPCTAPFMATALGVALTQPAPIALLVFATLGFGMALPFLALSYSPALASKLPAPGPWMDVLKQVLAFPLLATCVWLLWVLGNQVGSSGSALVMCAALLICFALWLTRFNPTKASTKAVNRVLLVASLLGAVYISWQAQHFSAATAKTYDKWETFTMARLEELRADGEPVFVNLTADWCITCKVNQRVAFSSDEFFNYALEHDVTLMVGDWTNPNPEIEALLAKYKRSGIPLYLVYPAGKQGDAEILPQLLTPKSVMAAIDRAVAGSQD